MASCQVALYLAFLNPVIPTSVSMRYRSPPDGGDGIPLMPRSYMLSGTVNCVIWNEGEPAHVSRPKKTMRKNTIALYMEPIPYDHLQLITHHGSA